MGGWWIGDWTLSPIPNPQSPIPFPNPHLNWNLILTNYNFKE